MSDKHKGRYGQGKFSPARVAWANLNGNEFILYDTSKETNKEEFEGQQGFTVLLNLRQMRRPTRLPLGHMTADEIRALRDFFQYVFDQAIPLAEELDAEARQAWEVEGDGDFARLYRTAPQLVIRERDEPQHREGVPSGPDGVAGVDHDDEEGQPSSG